MRYVLDASAALCWVLPRPNSGKALKLRADFQNAVHELIAPSVFSGEVASALTKAERQRPEIGEHPFGASLGTIDADDAEMLWTDFLYTRMNDAVRFLQELGSSGFGLVA